MSDLVDFNSTPPVKNTACRQNTGIIERKVPIIKINQKKRIVYGIVYAPQEADAHNHFMSRDEIENMYKKFSGFGRYAVKLKDSFTVKDLQLSLSESTTVIESIFGIDEIMSSIKILWTELFSATAMEYREKIRYEGPLTVAVVISKEPVAEISVISHGLSVLKSSNEVEIEAILGDIGPLLEGKLNGDRYMCNIETMELVEKNVIEQKWMIVSKFSKGEFKKYKLDISPVWKSRQKLSDEQVHKVLEITVALLREYKTAIDVKLAIELGKIFVLDLEVVKDVRNQLIDNSSNYLELRTKLENEPDNNVELDENEQDEENGGESLVEEPIVEEPRMIVQEIEEQPAKSIVDYVKEVNGALEDSEGEGVEDDGEVEDIKSEKKLNTILSVYANDFDKSEYQKVRDNVEGIVMLSGEKFLSKLDGEANIKLLVEYIVSVAKYAHCPVIYKFAPNLLEGKLFSIETEAIRQIRNTLGNKNLWVSVPFVRTVEEFLEFKKMIFVSKLRRSPTFKIFTSIDNAASAMIVEDLIEAGTDGIIYELSILSKSSLGESGMDKGLNQGIKNLLKISLKSAADRRSKSIVNLEGFGENLDLQEIVSFGATAVAVDMNNVMKTKHQLKDIELSRLKKHKKK